MVSTIKNYTTYKGTGMWYDPEFILITNGKEKIEIRTTTLNPECCYITIATEEKVVPLSYHEGWHFLKFIQDFNLTGAEPKSPTTKNLVLAYFSNNSIVIHLGNVTIFLTRKEVGELYNKLLKKCPDLDYIHRGM